MRWPVEWTDAGLLRLIEGGPINCLLMDGGAGGVAEAAGRAGVKVLEWKSLGAAVLGEVKWDAPVAQRVISGLVWPQMRMTPAGGRDDAQAGPTGAPWIDSNSWVAHLARARGGEKPLWLSAEPDKDTAPGAPGYQTAIADSSAAGARWVVNLDAALRQGLAAGQGDAVKTWRSLVGMLGFFEQHRKWSEWAPWGALGVLSDFAGEHEYMGHEMLNLSARRNLHSRVLDRAAAPGAGLDALRAIVYVDPAAPSAQWKAALMGFAQRGGLLIVPKGLAAQFPGGAAVASPVAGYLLRSVGKGRVASSNADWEDPYFLAQEVHSLVSRRHDPVRIFNARSLWEHYSEAPDGRAGVLQLVGFSNRPYDSVSIVPQRQWRTAALHVPGTGSPAELKPEMVEGKLEYHLPPFSAFAALEFGA